jgi:hypothetical protein
MLPFTPSWQGAAIYGAVWQILPGWAAAGVSVVLLGLQALLVIGFIRHGLCIHSEGAATERWIWLVYTIGLAILLLVQFAIGWTGQPAASGLTIFEWFASFGVTLLTGLILWLYQRKPDWFAKLGSGDLWSRLLSLDWAYPWIGRAFGLIERMLRLLNSTLEGRGGLLWALLWLMMLFSLALQFGGNP